MATLTDLFGNEIDNFYQVEMASNEKTQLSFDNSIAKPRNGEACLSFRYKKYLKGKAKAWSIKGSNCKQAFFVS